VASSKYRTSPATRDGSTSGAEELMSRSAAGATVGVAEAVAKGGISTDKELLISAIRGRKVRNIIRKIKENIHKILPSFWG
jgi:hypothetical protein